MIYGYKSRYSFNLCPKMGATIFGKQNRGFLRRILPAVHLLCAIQCTAIFHSETFDGNRPMWGLYRIAVIYKIPYVVLFVKCMCKYRVCLTAVRNTLFGIVLLLRCQGRVVFFEIRIFKKSPPLPLTR